MDMSIIYKKQAGQSKPKDHSLLTPAWIVCFLGGLIKHRYSNPVIPSSLELFPALLGCPHSFRTPRLPFAPTPKILFFLRSLVTMLLLNPVVSLQFRA